jgi:hypothetical protein
MLANKFSRESSDTYKEDKLSGFFHRPQEFLNIARSLLISIAVLSCLTTQEEKEGAAV